MIKYDGMPEPEDEPIVHEELNEVELMGYILARTKNLTYSDVEAILKAETEYLVEKGFIEKPER